jgi:hypothetical protein
MQPVLRNFMTIGQEIMLQSKDHRINKYRIWNVLLTLRVRL